jgi:hypothetical protein
MTDTVTAYNKHDFIRNSVDLLCAGAAWRGGKFVAQPNTIPENIISALDKDALALLVKSMLLKGVALVAVTTEQDHVSVSHIHSTNDAQGKTVIRIERVESSFDPTGEPILQRVITNVELYEKAMEQIPYNSDAVELLRYVLPSIHSALAIPPSMLDQTRISKTPVEELITGAIKYKSEVDSLRHNLRYGLNEVGDVFADTLAIESIQWEWNEEWILSGPCKFGHVYQVFLSKGITLDPIKNSELGGMKFAVQTGLLSNKTYDECATSYGVS